jgi:hypothetical protein
MAGNSGSWQEWFYEAKLRALQNSHNPQQLKALPMLVQPLFVNRYIINKPHLTREHKRKRMEFARSHRDWTIEKWKQVIFSDETGIVARPSDAHKL